MNTWKRKELKGQAKIALRMNYWKSVLVGLLAAVVAGTITGVTGVSRAGHSNEVVVGDNVVTAKAFVDTIPVAALLAIGLTALVLVLVATAVFLLIRIFVLNPLEIGCSRFFCKSLVGDAELKEVFYTFDKGFMNGVKILLMRDVFTFLWTLLFVIPGIVKSYEYRMVPYILTENPTMSAKEVFALSKEMMKGNKFKALKLDVSFLLWEILGAITLGILNVFYIEPYRLHTNAALYQVLKSNQR